MTTLYQQIVRISQPIVKNYLTDITEHDQRSLLQMRKGDALLWACRDYGSHIAWLVYDSHKRETMTMTKRWQATVMSRTVFRAANDIWPGMQWYLLTATNNTGNGTMVKLSVEEGERCFAERISELFAAAHPNTPYGASPSLLPTPSASAPPSEG